MRKIAMFLTLACICSFAAAAEEGTTLTEEQNKKAAQLIVDLGSESFDTRTKAEEQLAGMGAGVLPLLKEAVAKSADAEVKSRANRVIKKLALQGENEPDALAAQAKEEALAKRYAEAEKYYAKAATLYKELADKAKDEAAKKELTAKAAKATEREKRAQTLSKVRIAGGEGAVQIAGGGAAAGVMVVQMSVNGQKIGDDDW